MSQPQKSLYKGIVVMETPKVVRPASAPPELGEPVAKPSLWILGMVLVVLLLGLLINSVYVENKLQQELSAAKKVALVASVPLAPKAPRSIPINADSLQQWWSFDKLKTRLVEETAERPVYVDAHSLELSAPITHWYGGGTGSYLAMDAAGYTHLSLNVFGYGPSSGALKIELIDDDNKNFRVDYRSVKPELNQDDLWAYTLPVDWQGWKHINIPFLAFEDLNRGAGDDTFNPSRWLGSGGLLQLQWVALGLNESGQFHVKVNAPRIIQIQAN